MEDRIMEITQSEQQIDKWKEENQSNSWDLWDNINIKHANLHIIRIPEEGEREGDGKYIWRLCGCRLSKL